jgi:hypothetical protein
MIAVPDLDTLDFDALVAEARALIPQFAPAWTDHNAHDPGITLLDLVAWIVDQQIYRLGFVGDTHLKAFAALFGLRPTGPQPAAGLVWPRARTLAPRCLAKGAAMATSAYPELAFRLQEDLRLTDAEVEAVRIRPVGGAVRTVAPDDRITLGAGDRLDIRLDRPLAGGAPAPVALGLTVANPVATSGGAGHGWGPITFRYSLDGEVEWAPVPILRDDTLALSRSGVIVLQAPAGGSGPATLRLSAVGAFFPAPPVISALRFNVLPVIQVQAAREQVLGEGLGTPDLALPFDSATLRWSAGAGAPDLAVWTDEGGVRVDWRETRDLERSEPQDAHFVIDPRRGEIRFGNGVNGRRPPLGSQVWVAPVERTAGAAGNLPAGRTWRVDGVDGDYGTNRVALSGGQDATSIDDLAERLQSRAARREVLLLDAELVAAAEALPGFAVGRADVIPGLLPILPGQAVCAARTLVVRPNSEVLATDGYVAAVAAALEARRVLGERLSVIAPRRVSVDIAARVTASGGDLEALRADLEARLRARLGDLRVRADIDPWPLGREVTRGEVEALLAVAPGVRGVTNVTLARGGGRGRHARIDLRRTDVAVAGRIDLQLTPVGADA